MQRWRNRLYFGLSFIDFDDKTVYIFISLGPKRYVAHNPRHYLVRGFKLFFGKVNYIGIEDVIDYDK